MGYTADGTIDHEFDDEGGYEKLGDEGGYEKLEDELGLDKSDD